MEDMKNAARLLLDMSLGESGCERLKAHSFESNNHDKVCYRFLGNLTQKWKKSLGLDHFPTEAEAVEIAKKAHPYFKWLFKDERELEDFKATYKFHADVWKDFDMEV